MMVDLMVPSAGCMEPGGSVFVGRPTVDLPVIVNRIS